jgi:hypothetical protein
MDASLSLSFSLSNYFKINYASQYAPFLVLIVEEIYWNVFPI